MLFPPAVAEPSWLQLVHLSFVPGVGLGLLSVAWGDNGSEGLNLSPKTRLDEVLAHAL